MGKIVLYSNNFSVGLLIKKLIQPSGAPCLNHPVYITQFFGLKSNTCITIKKIIMIT